MRAVWRVPVVCLIGGCFSKPANLTTAVDAAVDAAAPDAPFGNCAGIAFSAPQPISQFSGNVTAEPTITANLLEVYYVTGNTPSYAIGAAHRAVATEVFTIDAVTSFVMRGVEPEDPSISSDGDLLVYRTNLGQGVHAYYSERFGSMWSTPSQLVPGLEDEVMGTLDLRGNGLELYFNNSSNQLHRATRSSRSAAFSIEGLQLATDFRNPTVSDDGLEIWYNETGGVWHASRPSLADIWQPGALTFMQVFDPELTADGETLLFANGSGISISTRDCTP